MLKSIKVSTQLHWGMMKYWVDHGTGHANLLCGDNVIFPHSGRWLGWSGSMSGMMSSHTPAEDSQESGYAPWLSWKCCDLGPGGAARLPPPLQRCGSSSRQVLSVAAAVVAVKVSTKFHKIGRRHLQALSQVRIYEDSVISGYGLFTVRKDLLYSIKAHVDEDPWRQAFQYKVKSASGYFQKGDGAI